MNIVILAFYLGRNERGVERWARELSGYIGKKNSVTLVSNFKADALNAAENKVVGVNFSPPKKEFLLPTQKRAFLDYRSRKIALFTLKLIPFLLRKKYDVIIPTDGGWEPAVVRIITWLRRKKMVIVGHAGLGWDDINNLMCFPDCFVVLSDYAKKWAAKINPFVKIRYIPNGVSTKNFSEGKGGLNINLEKPVVLSVGALEKGKRFDLVIKAVAALKNMSLLIAGSGEEEENLNRLGKKLLGKRFLIKKFNFEKMPEVYKAADVFTLASEKYYSFEMVVLEAMAAGLPVVVRNDPVRHEIVGKAGYFVDPKDEKNYSRVLMKALNKNWADKPLKRAKKFSWEKVAVKYEGVFSELLES